MPESPGQRPPQVLDPIFSPRSVAVVGANGQHDSGSVRWGHAGPDAGDPVHDSDNWWIRDNKISHLTGRKKPWLKP